MAQYSNNASGLNVSVDNKTVSSTVDIKGLNIKGVNNITLLDSNEAILKKGSENILMQAWSPLAAGQSRLFENKILLQIAQNHNKTVAQIVLRWLVQRGIVPIVKSSNPARMRENLDIFNFEIPQYEMNEIEKLDTGRTCFIPRNTGEIVKDFLETAMKYNV